eukprot:scaffold45661_cov52-Phaeocystis_antarctica.AAC.2
MTTQLSSILTTITTMAILTAHCIMTTQLSSILTTMAIHGYTYYLLHHDDAAVIAARRLEQRVDRVRDDARHLR